MADTLLHKTRRKYLILSLLIFVVTAPLFYYFFNRFYIMEVDETLQVRKQEWLNRYAGTLLPEEVERWNAYNSGITLTPATHLVSDSLYYRNLYNAGEDENEPYRELRTGVTIAGQPHILTIRTSLLESEDFVLSIVILFLVMIAALMGGFLILSHRWSKRLWEPFYDTLRQMDRFDLDGDALPHFPRTDIEEFNKLHQSIDLLIRKNVEAYRSQREFVENAAHELQTPIAVFKAKLDTLIQREDLTEGQADQLVSLGDSLSRLNRLNRNLLLLSRIDRQHYAATEPVDMAGVVNGLRDFFDSQMDQYRLTLQLHLTDEGRVVAHRGLAEIMVSNLWLNAIRHNVPDGELVITLTAHNLQVANTGKPQPLDENRLFKRFASMDSTAGGNGLGLAIVRKIVDLHHWTIDYSYTGSRHIFTVSF